MAEGINKCADCKAVVNIANGYLVLPPYKAPDPAWSVFWLCEKCWDGIVSAAVMQAVR